MGLIGSVRDSFSVASQLVLNGVSVTYTDIDEAESTVTAVLYRIRQEEEGQGTRVFRMMRKIMTSTDEIADPHVEGGTITIGTTVWRIDSAEIQGKRIFLELIDPVVIERASQGFRGKQ